MRPGSRPIPPCITSRTCYPPPLEGKGWTWRLLNLILESTAVGRRIMRDSTMTQPGWTLEDIDWSAFRKSDVDSNLLAVVKSASLVEINSGDYVAYLRNVFGSDK